MYQLKSVTIRTRPAPDQQAVAAQLWEDITSGRLPILFNSNHEFQKGISPVSQYSNYAKDETGAYDLSILGVTADFFAQMEAKVQEGAYLKYDVQDEADDLSRCTMRAWVKVQTEQTEGKIHRAFTVDYESAVPAAYTKDGKAHCYLYIAVL